MCFKFSSSLLHAEKLHYHQVVFLKGNLMVAVEGGKRVSYSLPSTKTFLSGPRIATFGYEPASLISSTAMTHFSATDDMWVFALHSICLVIQITRIICKYYLPKIFSRRRKNHREKVEEQSTSQWENTIRSRCDWQYHYQLHRSTCRRWSDCQVKNVHLPS